MLFLFKVCLPAEKAVIDNIIDSGPQNASELDHKVVHGKFWGFMMEKYTCKLIMYKQMVIPGVL